MANTSKVDIFNLTATMLGAATIASATENSKLAKACNAVYDMLRRAELRKKPNWNFSIKTAVLAASATTPDFDRAYSYPLPADFLALADPYPEANYNDRDWLIQDGQIYTNYGSPLEIRYVSDVEDTSKMDSLFIYSLAAKMAEVVADSITQSNSKIQIAKERYLEAIAHARKANAFDNVSQAFPDDEWITVRL